MSSLVTKSLMSSTNTPAQRQAPLLTKSRSGCRDCRLRKVKCDEIKPVCSNCRRRYTEIQHCDWSTHIPRNGVRNNGRVVLKPISLEKTTGWGASRCTTDAHIPSLNLQPSSVSSTSRWRTLELRLMFHYTAVVRHTMPGCNGASAEAWQRIIPQLSFESELILDPMLALSALHLHAHSSNNPDIKISLRRYLGRSLMSYRQTLSNPSGEVAEYLWLSGVVLCHIYWLLAHQPQPNETYELPLEAFTMLEGVGTFFQHKNSSLGQQGYGWLGDEALPHIAPHDKFSVMVQDQLRDIEEDLTYLLNAFDVPNLPENVRNIYIEAKDYVLHHYQAFFSGNNAKSLQRFIGFMVVRCQPGYRELLKRHDPLAMALLARMLVLLKAIDHAWWAHGKGEYEVVDRDIRGIWSLMPIDLRWAMDWPCMVLDKEIILKRDYETLA